MRKKIGREVGLNCTEHDKNHSNFKALVFHLDKI